MRLHVSCPQKPDFGFLCGLYSLASTCSGLSVFLVAFFCVMFGTSFAEVAFEVLIAGKARELPIPWGS